MKRFWTRFIARNAPFIAFELRGLADEIDALFPQPPVHAAVLFIPNEGALVSSIDKKDTDPPFLATAAFTDADGIPVPPSDTPVWSSDNTAAATVEASEDGLTGTVTLGLPNADGSPAAAVISCTSTNPDGSVAAADGTVTVHASEAVRGDIAFSDIPTA